MGAQCGDQVGQGRLVRIAEGQVGQNLALGHAGPVGLKKAEDPVQVVAGCDSVVGNEFHAVLRDQGLCEIARTAVPAQMAKRGGLATSYTRRGKIRTEIHAPRFRRRDLDRPSVLKPPQVDRP